MLYSLKVPISKSLINLGEEIIERQPSWNFHNPEKAKNKLFYETAEN